MGNLLYKTKPYICFAVGAYALVMGQVTPMTLTFAGILFLCGYHIFSLRSNGQKAYAQKMHRKAGMRNYNQPKTYNID